MAFNRLCWESEPMPWDPDRYHRFQAERAAPFDDLMSAVSRRAGQRVVDLGCGPGELTLRLAQMLPESDVLGIDNSPEMVRHAEQYTRPGLRFALGDIASVEGQWDLVFSHAAIQWLDDHEVVIPRLTKLVAPRQTCRARWPSS
jgi:trans-aconitate 2-methyltransferase